MSGPDKNTTANPATGWLVLRTLISVLLLVSAGLKTHQLATQPILGEGLLENRWLLIAVVQFEFFFAFWLLSGLFPSVTRRVTVGLFSAFSLISLYKATAGEASCGCFGAVGVSPWFTFLLDSIVVGCLLRWRPHFEPAVPFTLPPYSQRIRLATLAVAWLCAGVGSVFLMTSYQSARLSDAGVLLGDGRTVLLEPETWVGKRFPLLDWIEIDSQLDQGRWSVVLHRAGCGKCEQLLREFSERRGDELLASGQQVAFVSFDAEDDGVDNAVPRGPGFVSGSLLDSYRWFGQAPLQLELRDGIVEHTPRSQELTFAGSFR